jgi:hypothetical protein
MAQQFLNILKGSVPGSAQAGACATSIVRAEFRVTAHTRIV